MQQTIPCPKCGVNIPSGFNYCSNCGFAVMQQTIPCPKCDAKVPSEFKYCSNCGICLNYQSNQLQVCQKTSTNWFQRHLNATAILAIFVGFIVAGLGGMQGLEEFTVGPSVVLYSFFFTDRLDIREIIFIILGFILCLSLLNWTLYRKKRSIWWLFGTFIPFGWFVVAFLGNKGEAVKNEGKAAIRWIYLRQVLCWLAVVVIAVLMILAANYDVPVMDSYYDWGYNFEYGGIWELFEIKDYSAAPLWVRLGAQHGLILIVVCGFLIYGGIKD